MVDEIPVDGKAVRVRSRVSPDTRVYPIGFDLNGSVPLLKKDNIRNDIRTGVGLEGVVGQADRAEEVRALGDILPCGAVLGVHGVAGGDEGHHAARTHLIQRFCEKVVVNGKTELVKSPVADLILSKRYVAHGEVEEVLPVGGFKAGHGNIRLGIELLCDSAGNTVQLHAVEPAAFHALRQHTEEVAHAHAGLQNVAGLEAHILHRVVNGADNGGTGVVGVQRGGAGGGVFLRCEHAFQFIIFNAPSCLVCVESVRKPAPADVLGEDMLFLRGGVSALGFDLFQGGDCLDVAPEFLLSAAFAEIIVHDAEVFRRRLLRHGRFVYLGLRDGIIGVGYKFAHFRKCRPPLMLQYQSFFFTHDGRVMLRLVKAQGTNLYIIGEAVFITGIYRHGFLGVGGFWFFFRNRRILCGSLFRLRIPLHEPREALPALRTGDGIEKRRVAEGNIKDADALDDIGLTVFQIHRIAYGIWERFSLRGGSCFGNVCNCFLWLMPAVLLHILIRNMDEVAEIEVFQLVGNKLLQRAVLPGFQMLIVQIAFQPEVHKVDIHLNGNLIVGDGGIGDADLRRVAEIRF